MKTEALEEREKLEKYYVNMSHKLIWKAFFENITPLRDT